MKYFAFLVVLSVTLALGIILSKQIGTVPPIGKLLDPNHGFWQNSFSEDMDFEEGIDLKNLGNPVKVIYDENLIPHIFAENEKICTVSKGTLQPSTDFGRWNSKPWRQQEGFLK
jgi:penicillin G amidase